MSEKPHWYMAIDGRGGYRPYSVDMGPIEPHYINSLEKAVSALTHERDEAVCTATNLAVMNGSLKSQLDGFREGARIGRDANRRETAYFRDQLAEAVRERDLFRQALVLVERLTDGAGMTSAELTSEAYGLVRSVHGLVAEALSLTPNDKAAKE